MSIRGDSLLRRGDRRNRQLPYRVAPDGALFRLVGAGAERRGPSSSQVRIPRNPKESKGLTTSEGAGFTFTTSVEGSRT